MKFFIDSADIEAITEFTKSGMVDGVTTVSYTHLRAHET